MKAHWNARFSEPGFAYGTQPNKWLEDRLAAIPKIGQGLFPAEGEGRNAVFAARKGWDVLAFDPSEAGRAKALDLANEHGVDVDYRAGALEEMEFSPESFDLLVLIYAHLPARQSDFHRQLADLVKPGGWLILEGFSKANLSYRHRDPAIGGPPKLDMLFSLEQIRNDFEQFDPLVLREEEVILAEGKYHNGLGSVIRFFGRKVSP